MYLKPFPISSFLHPVSSVLFRNGSAVGRGTLGVLVCGRAQYLGKTQIDVRSSEIARQLAGGPSRWCGMCVISCLQYL